MSRKAGLAPVVDAATRVLILGSLPGEASLAAQAYYAHPRNRFWHLVGGVLDRPDLPDLAYPARLAVLRSGGIGLWDAVASAERAGSLDSAIRNAEPADLASLVACLPALRAVAFNGRTAAIVGRRALATTACALIDLPSSSPAHAALSLSAKAARWMTLRDYLGEGVLPSSPGAAK